MKQIYVYGGGLAVGIAALYILSKNAKNIASGLVGAVGDAAAGAVVGLGKVVGIPETNNEKCASDIRNGRTWEASFSCPAGAFVGSVFNSQNINDARLNDARQIDRIIERQQREALALTGVYEPTTGEKLAEYDAMGNRVF